MARTALLSAVAASLLSGAVAQTRQFVLYSPGGDDTTTERIDPIVNPGEIAGHAHQVFGSNALKPNANYESLQSESTCTTVGSADGEAIAQDKSIYWHPSLYMMGHDGGYVKIPTNGHKLYYRDTGCGDESGGCGFPKDFRMVAGDSLNRSPVEGNPIQWRCYNGDENWGENGAFPSGVSNCASYPYLMGILEFPHCWNGDDFDPANKTAHTAYGQGDPIGGPCPSSHPIHLPHITMENLFMVDEIADKVKPDSLVLSHGDNTGYGWHADFFNGWDEGAIEDIMSTCAQGTYGNHDVGQCPDFKSIGSSSDCKLPTSYKENVETPGSKLPGCNPISSETQSESNPVAKLNADCNGLVTPGDSSSAPSESAGSSWPSESSAPVYSAPAGSQPAVSQPAMSQPAISVPAPAPSQPAYSQHGGWPPVYNHAADSAPEGGKVVYETIWDTAYQTVTTTYGQPAASGQPHRRHYGHAHRHGRRDW